MNTQSKSRVLANTLGRGLRKQSAVKRDTPNTIAGSSLQALAPEFHESAVKGVFQYSRDLILTAKVLMSMLAVLPFLVLALLVVRPYRATGSLSVLVNWEILGAVLSGIVALAAAALVSALLPTIHITPDGIAVSGFLAKRRVPWKQVGALRIMEVSSSRRYVVMIPFEGKTSPAPMSDLILALAGASGKGIIITSDMKNFERLLQLIVAYISAAAGQSVPAIEAFIDEQAIIPRAQMLFNPDAALSRMAERVDDDVDRYGVQKDNDGPELVWPSIITKQLLISIPAALFMFVSMSIRSDYRQITPASGIWLAVMLVFGMLELPFIAKLAQTVGDVSVGGGQFRRSIRAYVELQAPRAMLIMVGVAILGIGIPAMLAQAFWVIGLLITTTLTTRFVQRLYDIPLLPALLAGIGTLVFQTTLFALYVGLR